MSIEFKNPMSKMFGAFLREERTAWNKWKTKDVASDLSLSDSLYRLIESGNVGLNTNRIFSLIQAKAFEDSRIEFHQLAKYLVASHYLDRAFSRTEDFSMKTFRNMLDEVRADGDIDRFITRTEILFPFSEDNSKQKDFLNAFALDEVKDFLTNRHYSLVGDDNYRENLWDVLQQLPTLNITLVDELIETFKNHPPLHIGGVAQNWEDKNSSNFTSLIGVYRSHKMIISASNLSIFRYSYLNQPDFKDLRFIFLENNLEADKLKDLFIKELRKHRRAAGLSDISDRGLQKIRFKCLGTSNEINKDLEILFKGRNELYEELRAFWMFSKKKGPRVGFVGSKEKDTAFVVNLTLRETLERAKIFDEKLWAL